MSVKTRQIASQMMKEISVILNEEARNEILKNVGITDITVDSDLTYAKVYFITRLDDKSLVEKELNEASGFIRSCLAKSLDLRSTPKLEFVYDKSLDYQESIENIIEELKEGENDD